MCGQSSASSESMRGEHKIASKPTISVSAGIWARSKYQSHFSPSERSKRLVAIKTGVGTFPEWVCLHFVNFCYSNFSHGVVTPKANDPPTDVQVLDLTAVFVPCRIVAQLKRVAGKAKQEIDDQFLFSFGQKN